MAIHILIADPTRPAYRDVARECLAVEGWELLMPEGPSDDELTALLPRADVIITRRRIVDPTLLQRSLPLRFWQHVGARVRPEYVMPTMTSETHIAYWWTGLQGYVPLYGRTLGVVGLGAIGSALATRARAFGIQVLYFKRSRLPAEEETALGVEYRDLDALLPRADFLSLHLAHTPESDKLIDRRRLGLMKPTAILVNAARGGLVDEAALVEALRTSQVRLAAAPGRHDPALALQERQPMVTRAYPLCIPIAPEGVEKPLGSRPRGRRFRDPGDPRAVASDCKSCASDDRRLLVSRPATCSTHLGATRAAGPLLAVGTSGSSRCRSSGTGRRRRPGAGS